MVKLKLTMNADKQSTIYALNGKSYVLQPGQNILTLEYDDYVSLAKALSINPVDKPTKDEKFTGSNHNKTENVDSSKTEVSTETSSNEVESVEKSVDENDTQKEEVESVEKSVDENDTSKEVSTNTPIDYNTWSYNDLKAEYKSITGKSCKMKKAEIIAFLMEHNNAK